MTAAVIPFPEKVERSSFVARAVRGMDAQLPKMADDTARLNALKSAEWQWTKAYLSFRHNVATGRYKEKATAWDYANLIAEISVRRTRLEAKLKGVAR